MVRTRDLSGAAADGPSVSLVSSHVVGAVRAPLSTDALPPGVYALRFRNLLNLETTFDDALLLVPPAEVTALDEELICATPSARVGMTANNVFLLPPFGVGIAGEILDQSGSMIARFGLTPTVSGCAPVPFAIAGAQICTRLDMPAPSSGGRVRLRVLAPNPAPTGDPYAHLAPEVLVETFSEGPRDFGYASVVDGPLSVSISGGILRGGGASPSVRMDDAALATTLDDCTPLGVANYEWCRTLQFVIPQGMPPGPHAIDATSIAGCTWSASVDLARKPRIRDIQPASMCLGRLGQAIVTGDDFRAVVGLFDGQWLGRSECTFDAPDACYRLFPPSGTSIGTHQIVIRNSSLPPVDSDPVAFMVTPGPPLVGDPIPRRVYARARRPIFVPLRNVTGSTLSGTFLSMTAGPSLDAETSPVSGGAELTFPAPGVSGTWLVSVADESPCPNNSIYPFDAVTDPVLAHHDFEGGAEFLYAVDQDFSTHPLDWLDGGGNPGGAARVIYPAGGEWNIAIDTNASSGADYAFLKFDLLATGDGAPAAPPLRLFATGGRVEHAMPAPPSGAWTSYEIRLDDASGWTLIDAQGRSRPATVRDLQEVAAVWIPASWWSDGGTTLLDNVSIELVR
jgi:hypothetical protein